MSDEKWITNLGPTTPVADAARQVLGVRLAAVADRIAPAVEFAAEDVEHVHQLRVATRRAGAALRLFAGCFPDGPYRLARKLLRDVRRAAGEARDWDVFTQSVRETDRLAGRVNGPARSYLLGLASGCRAVAQAKLRAAAGRHAGELDRVLATLPAEARPPGWSPGVTAGELAKDQLGELFAGFNRGVAAGPKAADDLHQLRIAGKRLRYAIEVFAGCFPPPLREAYYPAVEQAQERLGVVNDAHVAADRLRAVRASVRKITPDLDPVVRPGLDDLIRGVKADAADGTKAFRKWSREWALLLGEHPLGDLFRTAAVTSAA